MFLCLKKETRSEKQETSFCSYVLMSSNKSFGKNNDEKVLHIIFNNDITGHVGQRTDNTSLHLG